MKKMMSSMILMASLALPALASAQPDARQQQQDQEIKALVTTHLQKKHNFQAVEADVDEGIVTLSGDVPLYIDRVNVEKQVRKVKNVDGVRNHVQVGGAPIADNDVRENLANKLRYDRIGYGIAFNNLAVDVRDGAVTVSGNVRDYPDRDSAIAIIATTAGVKEVVDEIDVAPVSIMDDGLRIKLARAIYGHSALQKYALDPQAPIRIVVENGHVELAGVVLSNLDRQVAFVQANSIPGVFSVQNNLVVATKTGE